MGSYAELKLGPFILDCSKYDVDPITMTLFQESDKIVTHASAIDLNEHSHSEGGEENLVVKYICTVAAARDRLEIQGFTKDIVGQIFMARLQEEIENNEALGSRRNKLAHDALSILDKSGPSAWIEAIRAIKENKYSTSRAANTRLRKLIKYIKNSKDDYGFPLGYLREGGDSRYFIRIFLDAFDDKDELVYDLTDICLSGSVDPSQNFVEYAREVNAYDYVWTGKVVIITEGITDAWILEHTLCLLYPHLTDYFHFMNFEKMKVEGGANPLANTVKAFAGAGIFNRTIALFDNDTAAESAIRSLSSVKLPSNIKTMKYPPLELAKNYPTIGPSGMQLMDVNGLAGSIELYLGKDILMQHNGELTPVQWKGYDAKLKRYQGEILNKKELQNKFRAKVKACENDRTQISKYDWQGIDQIFNSIRNAFVNIDAKHIFEIHSSYP